MHLHPVAHKIKEISHVLPCSQTDKDRIREMAIDISREYLDSLPEAEVRYPVDIALSSVYISSNNLGCRFSYSDISKNTGYSLTSWPRIVKDIQKREK